MLHLVFRRSRMAGLLITAVVLALLGIGIVASVAAAQATTASPRGAFRSTTVLYLHGADTIGTESVSHSATQWSGDLRMRGQPRIVWRHAVAGNGLGALSIDAFLPNSESNAKPVQQATLTVRGDTAHVEMSANGNTQRQAIPTKAGAFVLVNTSISQSVLVANTAAAQRRSTFDVVLLQGGQTLAGTVRKTGDSLHLTLQGIAMHARVDSAGLPIEVFVPSQNLRVVRGAPPMRGMNPTGDSISYDAPANAPYTAEHVRIPTDRGYSLAATLTRPTGSRPVAVAITISGSGPQDRDSRIAAVPGYAPFREIADTLARRGVATLRYDDRGVGESGGIETAVSTTSVSFADDVRSIVAWLRARPDIDSSRIMLIGHSEGGIIAPMVAAADKDVHAIAVLAGSAYTGRRVLLYQNEQALGSAASLSSAQRDSIMKTIPARIDSLAKMSNWLAFFVHHDPLTVIKRVQQPVLIVQGETDRQVTHEQADTLAAALHAAGNHQVTLKKFSDANHLFLQDPSGMPRGYGALPDTRVRRDILGAIADWAAAQAAK